MSSYEVGVQSVVYTERSLSELLEAIDEVGIEHLEIWGHHLDHADDEATIAAAADAIDDHGIDVCGHGVVNIEDTGEARPHFALADRLGADYVTVNYPPDRHDVTEELIDLGERFGLDVGIHNYSSVHHDDLSQVFSSIDDVRTVLEHYDHPRLGMCMDTGHFLVEDVAPEDVIRELGDRINSVHLKDTSEAEEEDVPGAGQLDVAHLLGLLDEHADLTAPLVIEYELPDERATEALEEATRTIREAVAASGGE
jgi:sugar phosphate isomerase/epimerase